MVYGNSGRFYCDCGDRHGLNLCKGRAYSEDPPGQKPRRRKQRNGNGEKGGAEGGGKDGKNKDKKNNKKKKAGSDEEEDEEEDDSCIVCMDEPKEALFFRCGHIATCMDCAQMLKQRQDFCPVCRQPILDVVKAFKV